MDCLEIDDELIVNAVVEMIENYVEPNKRNYDLRAVGMLLRKWDAEVEGHMDKFAY